MELSGKIFKVNPLQTGEGKNGPWKKLEIVVETDSGKYPKKVMVSLWGDLVNNNFEEGRDISVEFDVESREFNGRWYTDVKAWRINKVESGPANTARSEYKETSPVHNTADVPASQIDDDLPF